MLAFAAKTLCRTKPVHLSLRHNTCNFPTKCFHSWAMRKEKMTVYAKLTLLRFIPFFQSHRFGIVDIDQIIVLEQAKWSHPSKYTTHDVPVTESPQNDVELLRGKKNRQKRLLFWIPENPNEVLPRAISDINFSKEAFHFSLGLRGLGEV